MYQFSFNEFFEFRVTPERDLLIAIIKRAIDDITSDDKYLIDAASRWLFSKESTPYPAWSFGWVCEYLTYFNNEIELKSMILNYLNSYKTVDLKEAA